MRETVLDLGSTSDIQLRQIGQQRIATTIGFVNLTYNLFRFEQLMRLNKA